jgi:hypothetical protein
VAKKDDLVGQFVASFAVLDAMSFLEGLDPIASELRYGEPDKYGRFHWRPLKAATDRAALHPLYAKIPASFPPLFEQLVLSYRWAEVDLQLFRLLPNSPGENLNGLLEEMSKDRVIWQTLLPAGYIQFGRGPDIDYDPICFDVRKRTKGKDCAIVKIDHEQILCNNRVKIVSQLATTFEQLMLLTIDRAVQRQGQAAK